MAHDLEKENQLLSLQIKNLQTTLDHIGAYVFTKDLEGNYTYVNQLVRDLFEYPLEEIIGFDDSKFFSLDLSNDLKINDQRVMLEGVKVEKVEKNVIAKTGETHYFMTVKKPLFDLDGNVIGMFGVSTDITERMRIEQALEEANAQVKEESREHAETKDKLKLILDSVPVIIAYLNKDLRYEMANAYFRELHGVDPDDMIGLHLRDVLGEEGYAVEKPKYDEALTGKTVIREDHFRTKTGIEHWYRVTLIPHIVKGEVEGLFGLVVDLSDLKRAQHELQQLNKTLEERVEEEIERRRRQEELLIEQSKNAAMGEMIGVITHQWKQPITVISLLMGVIRDLLIEPEINRNDLKKQTEQVNKQLDHMTDTITDFRDFLKPSKNKRHFKASELANDVYRLNEAKFKDLAITYTLHEQECFEVYGLPNELRQVIMNIFGNACDVFQERGIIHRNIDVYCGLNGNNAYIKICDNGGGVPDELLPDKLFERYVSTKGEKGTGLGLQICQTIIEEKFDGKLWVHNTESGAEFVIDLPLLKQ